MVTNVTPNSYITQNADILASEFGVALAQAEELIDDLKKQDAKTTTQQLESLLIEYIIAQMSGDEDGAKAVAGQIAAAVHSYGTDIQNANALKEKVKSMAGNPTADGLAYLQNLIKTLEQDLSSGDMSNLANL